MTSTVISADRYVVPSSQFLQTPHTSSPLNIKLTCRYQHLASHSCTSCQTEKNIYCSLHLIAILTKNFYQRLVFTQTATEKNFKALTKAQQKLLRSLHTMHPVFLQHTEEEAGAHSAAKKLIEKQWPCTMHQKMVPRALLHSHFLLPTEIKSQT